MSLDPKKTLPEIDPDSIDDPTDEYEYDDYDENELDD